MVIIESKDHEKKLIDYLLYKMDPTALLDYEQPENQSIPSTSKDTN
jgi:hypothetical protein